MLNNSEKSTVLWYNQTMKIGALLHRPENPDAYTEALETEVVTLRARLSKETEAKEQARTELEKWRSLVAQIIYGRKTEVLKRLTDGAVQMGWDFDAPGQPIVAVPTAPEVDSGEEPVQTEQDNAASDSAPGKVPAKRSRIRRKDRLANLTRLIEEGEITPDEVITLEAPPEHCPYCDSDMETMVLESHIELVINPPRPVIREIRVPVQKCRNCEQKNTIVPIHRPEDLFVRPLAGCLASAETLATLFYSKNGLALPLYRLEKAFTDVGLPIRRQTLCNWYLRGAEDWLKPICGVLHEELCRADLIQSDETNFHVLKKNDGRNAAASGFAWVYMAPAAATPTVLFEFVPTRKTEYPRNFLDGFSGLLLVDGFSVYRTLERTTTGITLSGCWAHARRMWYKAVSNLKTMDPQHPAVIGFSYVEELFSIESQLSDCSPEDRFAARLRYLKPLLDRFRDWLDTKPPNLNTPYSKAVRYTLNQWPALYHILADGRLPATNNACEQQARNVAIGRKNFLFSDTLRGAEALMTGYSIVETAKLNGLNAQSYLTWIFREMPYRWAPVQRAIDSSLNRLMVQSRKALQPLVRQSITLSDESTITSREIEAAAMDIIQKKFLDPDCAALKQMAVAEGKRILARDYLPDRAPEWCRKRVPFLPAPSPQPPQHQEASDTAQDKAMP